MRGKHKQNLFLLTTIQKSHVFSINLQAVYHSYLCCVLVLLLRRLRLSRRSRTWCSGCWRGTRHWAAISSCSGCSRHRWHGWTRRGLLRWLLLCLNLTHLWAVKRVQEWVQNIYNWMWNEYRSGTEHMYWKETKCRWLKTRESIP